MNLRRLLIRTVRFGIPGLLLVGVILFTIGAAMEVQTEAAEAARFSPPGKMYDIGGRKLHLYCLGQADPGQAPVILVADSGESFYSWWNLQHQLASSGLVCSYDRSGYGWSEAGTGPRTTSALAEELQALLEAAGLQHPYLLVGHGFGGLIVRQYALDYPQEVEALVLANSLDAESIARLPGLLRKPLLAVSAYEDGAKSVLETAGVLRLLNRYSGFEMSPVLSSLPEEVQPAARAVYFNPRTLATSARERAAVAASVEELIQRKLPQNLPVISLVNTAAPGQPISPEIIQDFEDLSSNSQVRQLPGSGYYLQLVSASEVLQAVWELQGR